MTLLDLDTDTIQHLDFELEMPDPCMIPECNAPADFDVTHERSCGNHIKWCGPHTKQASENFSRVTFVFCGVCHVHLLPSSIIYTPLA
jgi:hypothetical protein